MNKLFQLAESTRSAVPDHFQGLVESLLEDRSRFLNEDEVVLEKFRLENDYIFCVFVTVAVECGFRLESLGTSEFDIRPLKSMVFQPNWRDSTHAVYKVDLYLPQLGNVKFILIGIQVLDHVVIVNILVLENKTVVRCSAQVLVPGTWLSVFSQSVAERFVDLPRLARAVRNFFQREKDLALNMTGEANPSLLGLPEELKRRVFTDLSAKDFVMLTATCKSLRSYGKDLIVWRYMLKRDFNKESEEAYNCYVRDSLKSSLVARRFFKEKFLPLTHNMSTSSTSLDTIVLT